MAKKNKKEDNFIDEIKRFSSFDKFKIGDWIVYRRVSDDKVSVGEVKWFCMSEEGMAVTVIDKALGNFQMGLCSTIERECSSSRIENILGQKKKT